MHGATYRQVALGAGVLQAAGEGGADLFGNGMAAAGARDIAALGQGAGHDALGRLFERFALELDRHGCGGRRVGGGRGRDAAAQEGLGLVGVINGRPGWRGQRARAAAVGQRVLGKSLFGLRERWLGAVEAAATGLHLGTRQQLRWDRPGVFYGGAGRRGPCCAEYTRLVHKAHARRQYRVRKARAGDARRVGSMDARRTCAERRGIGGRSARDGLEQRNSPFLVAVSALRLVAVLPLPSSFLQWPRSSGREGEEELVVERRKCGPAVDRYLGTYV